MTCKQTQAEQLFRALRKHPHTYGDLLALRVSTSPWRRLSESAHLWLRLHEEPIRIKRADGLVAFKIKRKYTKWTA